jgi:hypothetical protein
VRECRLHGNAGAEQQRAAQQLGRRQQLAKHDRGQCRGGERLAERQHGGLRSADAPQAGEEQQRGGRASQDALDQQQPGETGIAGRQQHGRWPGRDGQRTEPQGGGADNDQRGRPVADASPAAAPEQDVGGMQRGGQQGQKQSGGRGGDRQIRPGEQDQSGDGDHCSAYRRGAHRVPSGQGLPGCDQ